MILNKINRLYFNEAGQDGAADGGAAAAASAPAPAEPTIAAPASAISQGAAIPLHERIPEKFRVNGDGDKFDLEASAGKMIDAYSALEKRFGSGDVPPESADKYQIDGKVFGEDFDVAAFMGDEKTQSFLKAAHAKGMSNAQVQFAIEYAMKEFAPTIAGDQAVASAEQCTASLREQWGDEYQANASSAFRAFNSLPDDLKAIVDKEIGNNPAFNKVMAIFGKEMGEDRTVADAQGSVSSDITSLMSSEAYSNPRHPEHEKVSKQVRAYFEAQSKRTA